jgi:branched-chain amino acid transport system substrate-binding protein
MIRSAALAIVLSFISVVTASTVATAQQTPVTINVIVDQTGGGAFIGGAEKDALTVFEAWQNQHGGINGQPLHFVFYDDQTNPVVAVQLMQQVLASHPAIVLGPNLVATCAAVAPLLEAAGPVGYCFSPGFTPKPNGYMFASSASLQDITNSEVGFAKNKGWTRMGWIATSDATSQAAVAALHTSVALPRLNAVKLVSLETFNPNDISVTAQVEHLKAANVQVVVTSVIGPQFAMVLRTMHDAGLDVPVLASSVNTQDQVRQYKSFLPSQLFVNGLVFLNREGVKRGPLRSSIEDFYGAFKAAGATPTTNSGQSWDPALIMVSALKHLGPNATAQQVRDYILNLHGFAGVSGVYDFRNGNTHGLDFNAVTWLKWDADRGLFSPT